MRICCVELNAAGNYGQSRARRAAKTPETRGSQISRGYDRTTGLSRGVSGLLFISYATNRRGWALFKLKIHETPSRASFAGDFFPLCRCVLIINRSCQDGDEDEEENENDEKRGGESRRRKRRGGG